jgi:hypothetical protein
MFQALTEPNRDPMRQWLLLEQGERAPHVLEAVTPGLVVWSTLWDEHPEARIRFELPPDGGRSGTDLRWTLYLSEPLPEVVDIRRMRRRINQLINDNLRQTFDQ